MQRGACGVLGLVAVLAIGCGVPTRTVFSESGAPPDAGGAFALPDAVFDGPPPPSTITIGPDPIVIQGQVGVETSTAFTVTGTGLSTNLQSLQWFVADSSFHVDTPAPSCVGGDLMPCDYGTSVSLPVMNGEVFCTPQAMTRVVNLQAASNVNGVVHSVNVRCQAEAGGPSFQAPPSIGRVFAQVNDSAMPMPKMTITNDGNTPLDITVVPGATNAGQWSVTNCLSPATCSVAPTDSVDIFVDFHPSVHDALDSTVTVKAIGLPALDKTVDLLGSGQGGVIEVNDPMQPAFTHNFGTIGKNQPVTHTMVLSNNGNQTFVVTPTTPIAPFSITSTTPFGINGGLTGTFDVKCESASAMSEQTSTITLNTMPAVYAATPPLTLPAAIAVKCTIANTSVQVTNPLDFGELRIGDDAGVIPVTITNPMTNGPVTVKSVTLTGAPAAVTLAAVAANTPLAPGASVMTTLTLATGAVVDASEFMPTLLKVDIDEGGSVVTLMLPVTGKVGAPSAVVLPSALEFGTVCIGTPVMGEVTMTNNGTSTLKVQPPVMDSTDFVPLFTNPTSYPTGGATLMPMNSAVAGVRPETANQAGAISSKLRWSVDVPTEFEIPISLELIDSGTAVSPARLTFSATSIIDPVTSQQTITLQNCGPDAAFISYDRVIATSGSPLAWVIEPGSQARELLAQETMRVHVSFSPKQPGIHQATLDFDVGGEKRSVALEGEATGTLAEKTSFYACDCSGSGGRGGWTSWLIVGALALVLRRPRRRDRFVSAGRTRV